MLVLFDIDGTLLRTDGAGVRAFLSALQQIRPHRAWSLEGIPVAGQLDTRILRTLCERTGEPHSAAFVGEFRASYRPALAAELRSTPARALPGMIALVEALRAEPGTTIGLLTGNFSDTGADKVASAGFTPESFTINAFAEDGAVRRDLPPVAMARHRAQFNASHPAARTVIIGDTPDDVDCALHNGCRCLGVATGIHGREALADAGACHSVTDCSDTNSILRWLRSL